MANKVYPTFKANSSMGALLTDVVKAVMVDEDAYTYSDAHQFLSDIPSGARIAISGALTSKAVSSLGAFTSGNARLDSVTGVSVEAVALFLDSGVPTTSQLVAYYDSGVTGLPVTPAGASYNVIPDSSGWFVL